ncbi:MAG: ABC transporter C-terminal domain-containing protein, partial [Alphaproteobacteria bacterium]
LELRRTARVAGADLARLTERQAVIDRRLADPAAWADGGEGARLAQERAMVAQAVARAEDRWLAAHAEVEAAEMALD